MPALPGSSAATQDVDHASGQPAGAHETAAERPDTRLGPFPSGPKRRVATRSFFLSPHLLLRDRAASSHPAVSNVVLEKGAEPLGFEDIFRLFQFIGSVWGVNRKARAEISINSRFIMVSPFRSEHLGSDRCRLHGSPPRSRGSCIDGSAPSSPGCHTGMYPVRFRRFRTDLLPPACNLRLHAATKVPYFRRDRRNRAASLRRSVLRDAKFPGHQGIRPASHVRGVRDTPKRAQGVDAFSSPASPSDAFPNPPGPESAPEPA